MFFYYDSNNYEQTYGAAMGSPPSKVEANLYKKYFGQLAEMSAKFKEVSVLCGGCVGRMAARKYIH